MNTIAKWVVERPWLAWAVVLTLTLLSGWITSELIREQHQEERLSLLQTETERRSLEIMSQTLNGNVMGALGLLGMIDAELKREARGDVQGNRKGERMVEAKGKTVAVSETNLSTLESVSRSGDTEGSFLVKNDGIIGAAWYSSGKPSFGNNVKFRPYYQMAMQGIQNVYAAVGTGNAERMLYYSAPIYAENTNATDVIGAVVARVGLLKIDDLLRHKADIALLLSPQDVVFASSKPEWVAHIAGMATPERLKAIRDVKQFGDLFASKDPLPLPISTEPGIRPFDGKSFAVAKAKVQWNDPLGDWTLVVVEDLSRTVPLAQWIKPGLLTGFLVFVFGVLLLRMLHGQHAQMTSARQLDAFARQQQAHAERKAAIAATGQCLQQARTLEELGQRYLTELHSLLGIVQGALYVTRDEDEMHLSASYACAVPPASTLRMGDGLLGQCAVEKRPLRIDAPAEEGFWRIRSGLGNRTPRTLLMAPILLNDTLLGVAEVALLTIADADTEEVLAEMSKLLALNVEILRRSANTEAILESTTEAERASAERAHFQQVLIDTIPYPVFYKGADTRFLGFNQAYETTFNVRREDLVGKRVFDLEYLPETDRIDYQAEDETIIAACGSVQREMQIPFADGNLHDTLYYVSGFRNADGSPGGLVGTFIDISTQKEAQQNLERLADAKRFNRLSQGREARILQLKEEVNTLCRRLAEPSRYASVLAAETSTEDIDQPIGEHLKLVRLNWHDTYECGQADIDREHHGLFVIANDLINAVVAGHAPEAIQHIIDRLVKETVQHFAHEEAILREQGYPALDEHAAIHKALIDQAVHLIGEFKAGRSEPGPFFQFLAYDVIARHMLGEDRKFFSLFHTATAQAASLPSANVPALAELVDFDELQNRFSAFCESIGIAAAIADPEGNVLASSHWQDVDSRDATEPGRIVIDSCHLASVRLARLPASAIDDARLPEILTFLAGLVGQIATLSLANHRADESRQRLQQQAETLQRERIAALSLAEDVEKSCTAMETVAKETQA